MFQPQPTPFASGSSYYFTSSSHTFGFPSSSTSDSPDTSISDFVFAPVSLSSQSAYGIASTIPFGHYFAPQSVGGGAGAGAGAGSHIGARDGAEDGIGAGIGAEAEAGTGIGPRIGHRFTPTPASAPESSFGSRDRAGAELTADGRPGTYAATASRRIVVSQNLPCDASNRGVTCSPCLTSSSLSASSSVQYGHHHLRHGRQQLESPSPRNQVFKMEDQPDPHSMAAQQAAAKDYEPDLPVRLRSLLPC